MALAWVVCLIGVIIALGLLVEPATPGFRLFLAVIGLGAAVGFSYTTYRMVVGVSLFSAYRRAKGYPAGDPDRDGRPRDREEAVARRQLSRGQISRGDYERAVAYRRFVHGEFSRAQYRHALSEIQNAEELEARRSQLARAGAR